MRLPRVRFTVRGSAVGVAVVAVNLGLIRVAENLTDLTNVPGGYEQRTVLAQLSSAIFGNNTFGFYAVQLSTTLILAMAANTAFNGFPILASILADDRFLPKQLSRRGDRLVFSNGIIMLSGVAMLLIVAFDGSVTRLIQLYILGVFVSFTLSQSGMVVYWRRQAAEHGWTFKHLGSATINGIGAAATAIVLVIVLLTKFTHGAYLVVIAMPVLFFAMLQVKKHYKKVSAQLAPKAAGMILPSRIHAVVLISQVNEPALKALAFAKAIRPSTITALHVDVHRWRTEKLMREWSDREIAVPLRIVACEYRDMLTPVINYLERIEIGPRDVVQVFIPEYVTGHWWEAILHNQSALRLKSRLLYMPGVMVTSVPYQLRSAEQYSLERPGSSAPHIGAGDAPPAPVLPESPRGTPPISPDTDHDAAEGAKEGPHLAISHR